MSDAKTRKYHSPEFKAKVGLEAVRGLKTINEIGQEYRAWMGVGTPDRKRLTDSCERRREFR